MTLELREVVSVDIPVPLATVWPYLREPQLVHRWFGWDRDGLDAEIQESFAVGPVEERDVVGNATIHTLTWPHHDVMITARSTVSIPGHTRLTVTRRSHQGISTFDGIGAVTALGPVGGRWTPGDVVELSVEPDALAVLPLSPPDLPD